MSVSGGGIGRDFGGTLVSTLLPAAAGVVSGVILARTLGPVGRGEFASVLIWPLLLGLLGDFGVGFALTYFVARDPLQRDPLWTVGCAVSFVWGVLLSGAAIVTLAPRLSLSSSARTALVVVLSVLPFAIASNLHASLLLGLGRLRASNVIRASQVLLYAAIVVVLAAMGQGSVLRYGIAWACAQVVVGIGGLTYLVAFVGTRWSWSPALWPPVLAYGLRVHMGGLAAQASLRLDQVAMSAMGLVAPLGIYAVSVAVASGVAPVFTALAVVVLHRAARPAGDSTSTQEIRRVLRLTLTVGLPLVVAGIAFAPALVPLVFGRSFEPSVLPAQVLLVAAFFQGSNAILGNALRATGFPGRASIAEGIGCAATVALLLVLLPRYGALGAAVASLAAYATVTALQFRSLSATTPG